MRMMTPLSEAVDILDSHRIPVNSRERAERVGDIPYYGATGQVGVINDHIFDEELVLLGEDGAPFLDASKPKAYLIRGRSWVNNHAHVLRGKPGLLNSFLLYQLNSLDYRPFVSGTTRLKLPQGPMKRIPLLVPPESVQRQVVAEIEKQFTRLDAGVAALRRVQANLKRYRASVLKAACEGRLVPTEAELAKAEGRAYETGEQLLARILADRRKSWHGRGKYKEPAAPDTANLPSLPEGWVWTTVGQLADIGSGNTPARISDYVKSAGPIPWFKVGDMNQTGNEHVMRSAEVYLDCEDVQALGLRLFPSGTIIFPKRGGAIATNKKRVLETPATTDLNVMGMTPDVRVFGYLKHWFASIDLASLSDGSNVPQVNNKDIQPLPIPFPPLGEQIRIVAEVERRLSVIEEQEAAVAANLQRAARLRQSILKQSFSGGS